MKSIKDKVTSEMTVKKSTFIGVCYGVDTVETVSKLLDKIKAQYPDANHHCFAYIIGENADIKKFEDDGEPAKTAGFPILNVLEKQGLTNILCVVIRYFGGVKLGAGGLVRAYTKTTSQTLDAAQFVSPIEVTHVKITTSFHSSGSVEAYLRSHTTIIDTSYSDVVSYIVEIKLSEHAALVTKVQDLTSAKAEIDMLKTFVDYR